jgi:hypothetical protein
VLQSFFSDGVQENQFCHSYGGPLSICIDDIGASARVIEDCDVYVPQRCLLSSALILTVGKISRVRLSGWKGQLFLSCEWPEACYSEEDVDLFQKDVVDIISMILTT